MYKKALFSLLIMPLSQQPFAATDEKDTIDELVVLGSEDDLALLSGSAKRISREELEVFEYSDINQILTAVPGVYIRQEDGYGLRPNIGLRGVTADRSQKITLMEDGILITPAPYAAPAAYYIPNVNRMEAVEVFKGPAAIKFGPNTVGGAVNLATRPVPEALAGELDVGYGTNNFQRYRGLYGQTFDQFGFVIEGLRYSADGFKSLDSGADTGFERNDINTKLQWTSDESSAISQRLTVKLGYANENANETYLGLTEDDFNASPLYRYPASERDRFESVHYQAHAIHQMQFSDQFSMINRFYYNQFDRSWLKFDGFANDNAPTLKAILDDPKNAAHEAYMAIIRGGDSTDEILDVTNNDRQYGSYGIDLNAIYEADTASIAHKVEAGIRYHHDYVKRHHRQYGYAMLDGQLINGQFLGDKVRNKGEADAISTYIQDTMNWQRWTVNLGLRLESIRTELTDEITGENHAQNETALLPGIGAFYAINDQLGLLVGVNKGFSPNGPSLDDTVDPESSINYEYGIRYQTDTLHAEVIGFFSDYKNLIGRCGDNDVDCNEVNGGAVEVAGIETLIEQQFQWDALRFPVSVSYTYTESAFQSSFISDFSQWGDVQKGDEMPYLPEHTLRVSGGIRTDRWDVIAAVKYVSAMRDLPGQEALSENLYTPALTTVDISGNYQFNNDWSFQLVLENITDEIEPVSYRPFGARPNKPFSTVATVKYVF